MPMDCIAEGVNLTPSSSSVTGAKMKKDMMVMILNRLMLSSRTAPCIRGNILQVVCI